jgi:hypothetical protein
MKKYFFSLKTTSEKIEFINQFWSLPLIEGYFINYAPILKHKESLDMILEDCIKNGDREISKIKLNFINIAKICKKSYLINEFNNIFKKKS